MSRPVQIDLPGIVGNFSLYKVCLVVGVLQHVMPVCNCITYSILNRAPDTRTFCIFIICKCCHRNKGHIDNTYILATTWQCQGSHPIVALSLSARVRPATVELGNVKFPKNELTVWTSDHNTWETFHKMWHRIKRCIPAPLPYRQRKTSKQL